MSGMSSGVGPATPLSDNTPTSEGVNAAAGALLAASRGDHAHARLTSVTAHTSDVNGEFTVVFTRLFTTVPGLACVYTEAAANQPIVYKVKSWTQDGSSNYTGCVISTYRAQVIPQNLVSVLIGGVFNLFGAAAPSGIPWTCIAVQRSS